MLVWYLISKCVLKGGIGEGFESAAIGIELCIPCQ